MSEITHDGLTRSGTGCFLYRCTHMATVGVKGLRLKPEDYLHRTVQAFIWRHLNYCNSLFYGIAEGLMSRLQSAQNAAARLVSGARLDSTTTSHQCYRSCTGFRFDIGWISIGHPGLPVTVWHGSSLSGRRLSVGLRRRLSSATFCPIKDVRREANLQQLWRQMFCSCRSEAVEQPSS